ncbi:MAG: AI-2E family transporter [Anaerolineales bacterium]
MSKNWSPTARYFALALIIVVLALVAWYVREMFGPLVLAGIIAYLLYPLVEFLHTRLRMKQRLASHLVFLVSLLMFFAIPGTLLPILSGEMQTVANDLLEVLNRVEYLLLKPIQIGNFSVHLERLIPDFKQSISTLLTPLPEDAWRLLESTSRGALWFLVVVVAVYYFITDWARLREWLIRLAPEEYRHDVRRLYLKIKDVWMAYLRGQLTLMAIVGVTFTLIWSIIGLPGALVLGILGGIFSIIPDVGPFAAALLAAIVAALEGSRWIPWDNIWVALLVFGIYVVLINIKNIWLRPHILGRSVHMHEGLVFIAIVVAVIFVGVLGAFIIVPVLASLAVVGDYLRRRILGLPPFPEDEHHAVQSAPAPASTSRRRKASPKDKQ